MKVEFVVVCFACLLLRAQTSILKAKLKGIAVQVIQEGRFHPVYIL